MKKTLALAGIGAMALMGLAAPAQAITPVPTDTVTQGNGGVGHEPVTLCHRTGAADNPYVVITVDADAVLKQGHDIHDQIGNGPIGDIIPPFEYTDGSFAGKNWTAEGQAILANGCVIPVVTVTPTPTETTTTPVPTVTTTVTVPGPETTVPGPVTTVPGPAVTHTVPGGIVVQTKAPAPGQRGFNAQTAAGESTAMGNAAIAAGAALLAGAAGLALYRRQASRSH